MEKIGLKTASLPKQLAELTHSNQFLKMFSLAALGVSIVAVSAAIVFGTREPIILAFSSTADILARSSPPVPEDEVRAAAHAYIDRRYSWEPLNVSKRLKDAEAFIYPSAMRPYLSATAQLARFSIEKLVEQRSYPSRIDVNLRTKTVSVFGDRVTTIQGLKAAGNLRLELSFETGPRTPQNPWGFYVTREKEVGPGL